MKHLPFAEPAASPGQSASGAWKLPPGRAMTLSAREDGLFEVVYGEVWATFDGPHQGPPNDWGDHVMRAGERLWIPAGQHLVVEPWRADAPAFVSWEARSFPAVARPRTA